MSARGSLVCALEHADPRCRRRCCRRGGGQQGTRFDGYAQSRWLILEAGFSRCWSATAEAPHLVHTSESFEKGAFFTAELDWCPLLCVDSQVVDLVFAMEDMERGLQEMAQSVEHMQEMLKRSPMVQALAQHKPEVRAPSALLSQNGRRGFHQVTLYEATRRCFTHQLAFPTDDGGLSLKNSI